MPKASLQKWQLMIVDAGFMYVARQVALRWKLTSLAAHLQSAEDLIKAQAREERAKLEQSDQQDNNQDNEKDVEQAHGDIPRD